MTWLYKGMLKISDAHERILEKGVNTCIYRLLATGFNVSL